ncbi:hypothetical protein HYDPIDRAFT_120156 [Hydnomerulius pinastri MD-312]|uniref:Protein kinase domain-containing protein n=1 Tax=Hydnomerulius pinastri MD-312 TaxID=994086 RepID=A0A0C9UY22_9AGAM|nr:hypothetical protein HYDPIDRAFT_120156 [Hydnomerulius pinastri MD-312]
MNLSLRQVKIDSLQTTFLSSTGTVLFTSFSVIDRQDLTPATVVTSLDAHGARVETGLIKRNKRTEDPPLVCVGAEMIELLTWGRRQYLTMIFRGIDGRLYRWRRSSDLTQLMLCNDAYPTVIAVAGCDARPSPARECFDAPSNLLCIQPTGFHFLAEIVVTFILFEQLWEEAARSWVERATIPRAPCCGNSRFDASKKHPLSGPRRPSHPLTGSHVNLSGELLKRYRHPSAYGGFGDIWKCDWLKDSRVIEVAVKVMRTNLTEDDKDRKSKKISRELKVWSRLEHENVLPLYGVTFDFGNFPAMVCPWVHDGALSGYLERHHELTSRDRIQLLSDIAGGLQYLHKCGIVHGDLTGSNVLIKGNGKACLADFGLSVIFMELAGNSYLTSTIRGNIRWAAPELFEITDDRSESTHVQVLPSPQSDIYSFGSVALQVLTGNVPYHYYKNDAQVLVAVSRGLKPARPDEPHLDDTHWDFIQRCWSPQGREGTSARPPIEDVLSFLANATVTCPRD